MDYKAKLDRVFSQFIRLRDADENGYGRCISCGKVVFWKDADCGHYVNRKHLSLRWSEVNCNIQCRSCNRFDEGNLPAYGIALQKKHGDGIIAQLLAAKHATAKHSEVELKATTIYYEKAVKRLRNEKGL